MPEPPVSLHQTFNAALDADLVEQLACPACHGDLRLEKTRLLCVSCGCQYPIVDGIPVLLADHVETADSAS
jgi:hypothetical protein